MRKIQKRLLLTIMSALIISSSCFGLSTFANTNSKPLEESNLITHDGVKFSSTIPENLINELSPIMLEELKQDDGEVVSIVKQQRPLENTDDNNSGIRSVMPTYDFEMIVAVQRISEKTGDNFKFVAAGQWYANPTFEFTDCIALAWSDEFTLYEDYSYTYNNATDTKYYSACTRNRVVPESGVAYDADLILGRKEDQVCLVAKVYKANSSGSANVVGEYGHVTMRASGVDVSFSPSDISMSVGVGAGLEMASPDYAYFNY